MEEDRLEEKLEPLLTSYFEFSQLAEKCPTKVFIFLIWWSLYF